MKSPLRRRQFLQHSAAGATTLSLSRAAFSADDAPSRRLRVMGIGLGGRGTGLAEQAQRNEGTEVIYVCDPDVRRQANAVGAIGRQGGEPKPLADFRSALDDKSIDAVLVATPDHWHTPAALLAMQAGKHVYVEKPCCHNPAEGEMLLAAARKYDRIVQHGTQRRSCPGHHEAIQKLHAGVIGEVLVARAAHNGLRSSIGHGQPAEPPAWLDWNLWQGPAPRRPFRDNYIHYNWHFFWAWGCSEIGNNGVHKIDIARWGLGVDLPKKISSAGGVLSHDDDRETPDTHWVNYDYGDKLLVWENMNWHRRSFEPPGAGLGFYGRDGSLIMHGPSYKIYDMRGREIDAGSGNMGNPVHMPNFLDSIREKEKPNAPVDVAVTTTNLCHLGSIALRTGTTVDLDPSTGRPVAGSPGAALWARDYEPGWEPKV
jgi:predicted dehydrogenase